MSNRHERQTLFLCSFEIFQISTSKYKDNAFYMYGIALQRDANKFKHLFLFYHRHYTI